MIKTKTKPAQSKSKKPDQGSKARTLPHMTIPTADLDWALNQSPTVLRLLCECWKSDPYGSRWMPLTTTLRDRNLRGAKKILRDAGLFDFKTETRILEGKQHYETMVINLHGSRTIYWKQSDNFSAEGGNDSANEGNDNTAQGVDKAEGGNDSAGVRLETITKQAFQNLSGTFQEHLKNSSKEFLRCDSDTPNTDLQTDETAIALLGSASPPPLGGVSESEESPTAMDCTPLTLVEATESQPASLDGENQDSGVEPKILHEDTDSAAASNKWSDDAIAKRRELRPQRENKLKLLGISGDNPGFEYLKECWEDVGLWNKIKALIAQYPEWGITCVDGYLVGTIDGR